MAEAGKLRGVADEGGYWPDFATNEEALDDAGRGRSSARASRPASEVAIALDVAASEFGADGRYRLALDGRELDTDGMIELLLGWLERYPIVSIEDPLAEDDPDGLRRVHARGRRHAARSSATTSSSPTPPGCAPRRQLRRLHTPC